MAQEFKEVAHLKTNLNVYGENHDHIFNKQKCKCEECEKLKNHDQEVDQGSLK